MGVLRSLEGKIEGLVEGVFARTFKSRVQPVELARKLAKEMEESKTVSVSRVYVPNEYSVFLSPADFEQFMSYQKALCAELSTYLIEHARKEGLALLTRPAIELAVDERLRVGEFGIQARMVKPPTEDRAEPSQGDAGRTRVYSPVAEKHGRRRERPVVAPSAARAFLVTAESRWLLEGSTVIIGRSRQCDLVVADTNVSRRHAKVHVDDGNWYIDDLGSTNGVVVNGRRVESARLSPGDEIMVGTTAITFELE